ncbi:MAG: hypothetical protein PHG63_01175 [Candidatus Dojkabacteria bacterium]|nr:hypothetical protein [Candidatus Dojkabacteria bacterium]
MTDISEAYLSSVRRIFEKRYKRKLTETEVKLIAFRLLNFGRVIQNFYHKKKEQYGDKYDIWLKDFIKSEENTDK